MSPSPPTVAEHARLDRRNLAWYVDRGFPALVFTGGPRGESPLIKNRIELVKGDANGRIYEKLYPMQVGYRPRGQSGTDEP